MKGKRFVYSILLTLCLIIMMSTNASAYPVMGNTSGNLNNSGIAAIQGDWIYYRNEALFGNLYKIKTDDSGKTKLNDDDIKYINVVGDWIYYINLSDYDSIYKIKTDGSGRSKVIADEASFIAVVDDWIYYINEGHLGYIYKIKTDGSSRTDLKQMADKLNISGDWIYYMIGAADSCRMYKMKFDGSHVTKICAIGNDMVVQGDWAYYTSSFDIENMFSKYSRLYKVSLADKSINIKLNDEFSRYINIANDWIYYIKCEKEYKKDEGKIYRRTIYGEFGTQVNNHNSKYINVVGNWVYYINIDDGLYYRIKTDGTSCQMVEPQ